MHIRRERTPKGAARVLSPSAHACVWRQLLEDLADDLRLTFRRIAARRRPSPVVRRLAVALTGACRRIDRATPFAAAAVFTPPPRKRRRTSPAASRLRVVCEPAGSDSDDSERSEPGADPSRPPSRRARARAASPPRALPAHSRSADSDA